MKRCILLFLIFLSLSGFSQQPKKPTIMVVPEKAWCINNGYSNDGIHINYHKALLNNDVLNVITTMGDIMAGRDYPLKSLSSAIEQLDDEKAIDMIGVSKNDSEIVEDDFDKLTRVANADIIVSIAFTRASNGPRSVVEFRVSAIDAATSKQIAGYTGTSSASNSPMPNLLNEAVLGYMDAFCEKMSMHFQRIMDYGREGTIIMKLAKDCPLNFESEISFNSEKGELSDLIDYWLNENTVNGAFLQNSKSRVRLSYEQVHFPLMGKAKFGGKSKSLSMQDFVKPLCDFLSPYGISISTTPIGIGKVYMIFGGK